MIEGQCPICDSNSPYHRCPGGPPPCRNHGRDAVCTECIDHHVSDSYGFPHPTEARGRTRYQRCGHCEQMIEPPHWVCDVEARWFGCIACFKRLLSPADAAAPTPR